MSTYGWAHLSGVGNVSNVPVTVPGGPNQAVQYNKNGVFSGDATMTFDDSTGVKQLTVSKIKPDVILDNVNSTGSAGQLLSSTGSGIAFINPPSAVPGLPLNSIQFNKGGVFTGNSKLTYDDTLSNEKMDAPYIRVLNNVEPLIDQTGQVGTTTHKWADMHAVAASIQTLTTTSIYDSTNSIGTTGYVLGNSAGNIVWQPSVTGTQRAQFSSTSPVSYIGSSAIVLQTETFTNGVQLTLPPPIQFFEVLVSGNYLVTYNVDFLGTSGNGQVQAYPRKFFPGPAVFYATQKTWIKNGEYGHVGNSVIIAMSVGDIFNIQIESAANIDVYDVNVVVQRI
jgi:hypothetical protein